MVKCLQNIGLVEEYSVSLYVERLQRDDYKELQNHQKGTQNDYKDTLNNEKRQKMTIKKIQATIKRNKITIKTR